MTSLGPRVHRSRSPFLGSRIGQSTCLRVDRHGEYEVQWITMVQAVLCRYHSCQFRQQIQRLQLDLPEYDPKHDFPYVPEGTHVKALQSENAAAPSSSKADSTVATLPPPSRRVVNRKVGARGRPLSAGDHPIPRPDDFHSSQVRGRSWGKTVQEIPIFTPPDGSRAPTPHEASQHRQSKRHKIHMPRTNARPKVVTATGPARSRS